MMTQFIRQIKSFLRSKEIAFYICGAATPAAYELGFDPTEFADERIIDRITFTEFLNTGLEMPVEQFREIVGACVAIYRRTDVFADQRPGLLVRYMPYNKLLLSGFAHLLKNVSAKESNKELITSGKISGARMLDQFQIAEFSVVGNAIHK